MMRKEIRGILCGMLVAGATAALAQLPDAPRIADDLSGPFLTSAAQPLLREHGPLARRAEALMKKQAAYLISTLRPWETTSGALTLTDSRSGEHGIRPNAHTVYGLAVLSRTVGGSYPEGLSPGICRDRAVALLRFLLPTHGAGGVPCSDGKPWKDQWQSALWADRVGEAAWLLWDDLDPELRWLAARMIADEADRFLDRTPPAGVEIDTKAEENAWNSAVIALAANMFPHHPHAARWRKTAAVWAVSSFVREADLRQNPFVDGFRLRDVLAGPVIHDDYTLENHDRVHPDYLNCINACRYQRLLYTWSGFPTPESASFNTTHLWTIMKKLSLPDGSFVYANGQDWQIHRNPNWIDTHAGQAVWENDRSAALLMRLCLEAAERMSARTPRGGVFLPDEYFFPSTEQYVLDLLGDFYLLLRGWGEGPEPLTEQEHWQQLSGRHLFEAGRFALVRTPHSVSSFSWGRQVMGMVLPLQKDLLLNPNERGLIGTIAAEGVKSESPRVLRTEIAPLDDGFGVAGILDRAEGRIEQRFAFVALPDGRTVYVDCIRTSEPATLRALNLGTLGVLNEPHWVFHDGDRTVYHDSGQETFTAAGDGTPPPAVFHSAWCNLDDALGIICLGPNRRQVYLPNRTPAQGRLEQLFHLNSIDLTTASRSGADHGTVAARTALVFHPGQKHQDTARVAAETRTVSSSPHNGVISLEDGTKVTWDLQQLAISVSRPASAAAAAAR